MALTDKQLAMMDAKRLEEREAHQQQLDKGLLEISLLNAKIDQAKKPPAAPAPATRSS
jgi:hypothetical protein